MKILGVLIIIAGIALGIYLGIYLMLFGGIVQIVNGINPVDAKDIALGVLRVLFCEIGFIPVAIGWSVGVYFIMKD